MKLCKCVCGGQRAASKIVCHDCWEAAPAALITAVREAGDHHAVCRAARRLTDWCRARQRQPELF